MRKHLETGQVANVHDPIIHSTSRPKCIPVTLKDDPEYLGGYNPQSYTHWRIRTQLEEAKLTYDNDLKVYNGSLKLNEEPNGTQEKKAAVQSLLVEFEDLEAKLLEAGAKTFSEVYPDVKIEPQQDYGYHNYEPEAPKAWEPLLSFQLPALTDEGRLAYGKLFEAKANHT